MCFSISHTGILGEVPVDFGDDLVLDVGVQAFSQVREGLGRRGDHQGLDGALARQGLQRGAGALREPVLLDLVPVRRLHRAMGGPIGAQGASRPVGSLFMGARVFVRHNLDGDEISEFLVSFVAEEQRLAAISDEDEGVMRY